MTIRATARRSIMDHIDEQSIKADQQVAVEVIDFQNEKTGLMLEELFTNIKKKIVEIEQEIGVGRPKLLRSNLQNTEEIKNLEAYLFKRFGIKIHVDVMTTSHGHIMPMFFNEHHILLNEFWRGSLSGQLPDQDKIREAAKDKKGTIDLKNARVGGIFSEYEHELGLDVVGWLHYLEADIRTPIAVMLHEIGHAFTYYEFVDRIESTNQVMANLSSVMKKKDINQEDRVYVLRELEKSWGKKSGDFDTLIDEENRVIFGFKLFKKYVGHVKSQLSNSHYDQTASEQLADNFATRFGFGRDLIEGLDKLYEGNSLEKAGDTTIFFFKLISNIRESFSLFFIVFAPFIGGAAVLFLAAILFLVLMGSGELSTDMTYDELKLRYKRIRDQYIEKINQMNLSREELIKVIDEVHSIDAFIKTTNMLPKTVFQHVSNFLFKFNKEALESKELQYLIEELAHNDLFLLSAKLKTL